METTRKTGIKQAEEIRPGCRLDLLNLPIYDKEDHELSVRLANQFSLWLEEMGISDGVLVVRDEYDEEEANILHYLAKVRVGEDKAELIEGEALTHKYSFVEDGTRTNGSVKIITRLPAVSPQEVCRELKTRAMDRYKELIEEFYPTMNTTYDPNGPRFG